MEPILFQTLSKLRHYFPCRRLQFPRHLLHRKERTEPLVLLRFVQIAGCIHWKLKNKRCNAKIILTLFGPRKPYLYLSCITLMVFCFSDCSCVDPMLLIWILIYDETDATSYSQFLHTTDQPWAFLISSVLLPLLFSFLSLFCLSAFVCDGNRDSHVRRRSYHAIFSRFPPFATWSKFDSVRHYQQFFVFSSKPPEALSNTADVSFARDTLDFSQFWLKNYSITLFFRERQWDRT